MNLQQIADTLEFDLEDVEMLMDMFLSDAKESLHSVESTIESNDFEQMKNIAHSIKGSASNLMLEEIREIALQIEESAKTETLSDYKSLFTKLEDALDSIEDIKIAA